MSKVQKTLTLPCALWPQTFPPSLALTASFGRCYGCEYNI